MNNSFLLESEILFELLIAGGGISLMSALSVYYFGIAKRNKQNQDSLLAQLDLEMEVVLNSLISLSMQYEAYQQAIQTLQQSHTWFIPFEFNSFEYLKDDWNVSYNAFSHNKELTQHLHAFTRSLTTISLFAQRTHKRIDAINQKYENRLINAQQTIQLYDQVFQRDKLFIPEIYQTIGHGFVLWVKICNKDEDPYELYKQTRDNILNAAQAVYDQMMK